MTGTKRAGRVVAVECDPRLARDLGFPLDARPADLDAAQWAGLYAVLEGSRPGKTR